MQTIGDRAPTGWAKVILAMAALLLCGGNPVKVWAAATWTKGVKKVLIIPVRFTDQAGPSDAPGPGGYLSGWGKVLDGTTSAAVSSFFAKQSYNQISLLFTVLPEIDMGVSYTVYNAPYGSTPYSKFTMWSEPGSFADDVRNKARLVGLGTANPAMYDTANYDLDIVACGFIPGQGAVASGLSYGKGVFALTFKALSHELCHNLGLQHAFGISRATGYSPIKNGTFFMDTYGDVFDLMGWKNTSPIPLPDDRDANTYWKNLLGWLPDDKITSPPTSGTYRIHAFDQGSLEDGKSYAIRIVRDPHHTYWFDYRQAITGTDATWSANGLGVRFGGESIYASSGHTMTLDMTPGSRGPAGTTFATMHDAPLALGRTYTDEEFGLHVTPIRKGGTTPESLDVVVNYGPFPGNGAPSVSIAPNTPTVGAGVLTTFTATASDPDGDTLAYYWEFDDSTKIAGVESGGSDGDSRLATQGSHSWTRNGVYFVRCTVTDMKGHVAIASASVTVTGGSAPGLTISGIVKDEFGNPLQGAVVNNFKATAPNAVAYGAANFAGSNETAADGRYFVQLPAATNTTYTLTAMHQGYAFSCSVPGGAVYVASAGVANVDFTRIRATRTISGAVVVGGRAYDPATDGALSVSDGSQTVSATLGHWQMSEPDGTLVHLTATPSNPASSAAFYTPNPYRVVDDFDLLHIDVKIPGKMPQTGFVASAGGSDDTIGAVNIPVTLTPPVGYTSWPADQSVYYWIDESSTGEYGVDYKMSGGRMTFSGGTIPSPRSIPLTIIHDGVPKVRTVVIRLSPASSITSMGPITTYTYTITNAPTAVSASWVNLE